MIGSKKMLLAAAACLLGPFAGSAQPAANSGAEAPAPIRFDTLLRPVRDGGTDVAAIAVRSVIRGGKLGESETFSLSAPIVYAGVRGIADRVENLVVADRDGVVPMRVEDDKAAPGGFPYFRHWRATRAVNFPVTITYRSLVEPVGAYRGPPFGIRALESGVAGAGSGFLVIPENGGATASAVKWDLGDLPPGSLASSSFGDGDFILDAPPAQLMQGWYLAGPAGRFPASGDVKGFSASWLGTPPWNPHIVMADAARIFSYLGTVFPHVKAPRYRVFARILDTPPFGGGTALTNSFMLSRGPAAPGESTDGPQGLLFHEMIHGFVGGIEGPVGVTSWFSEGLTSYYTTQLQLRGGFHGVEDYGRAINRVARDYYLNKARNWSADRIVQVGFSDNDIRHLPYRRGELYFADLDSKIRAASGGGRNLDLVMREIFEKREQDWKFDHDAWRQIVAREAGPAAAAEFDRIILAGTATLAPAADAFGPCFTRQPTTYEAEDHLVEGWHWVRVEGVPDSRCAK